jgi:hypothetical protein
VRLLRSKDGGLSEDCGEFVWSCWRIRGCEAGKSVRPCDGIAGGGLRGRTGMAGFTFAFGIQTHRM